MLTLPRLFAVLESAAADQITVLVLTYDDMKHVQASPHARDFIAVTPSGYRISGVPVISAAVKQSYLVLQPHEGLVHPEIILL